MPPRHASVHGPAAKRRHGRAIRLNNVTLVAEPVQMKKISREHILRRDVYNVYGGARMVTAGFEVKFPVGIGLIIPPVASTPWPFGYSKIVDEGVHLEKGAPDKHPDALMCNIVCESLHTV